MFRNVFIIIALVVTLTGTGVSAQEDVEEWRFAFMRGSIAAYNLKGEMNVVLEVDEIISGARLGPQAALVEVVVDDTTAIYKLTPDSAEPLVFDFDLEALEHPLETLTLVSPDGTHAVLFSSYSLAPAALVNLETNTGELLTDLILHPQNCCRFSADGAFLRYPSGKISEDEVWTLWERDLATGEERAIHEYTRAVPLTPDRYGEYWLYSAGLNADTQTWSYTLVQADGTTETIDEFPATQEYAIYWTIMSDVMVAYNAACGEDCTVEVHPLPEGEPVTYSMPSTEEHLVPLYRSDAGLLTWHQMAELWFLPAGDSEAELIGFSPMGLRYEIGNRWVVVADAPDSTKFKVWDNLNQTFVMEDESAGDRMFSSLYENEAGFLLVDLSAAGAPTYLYREGAGEVIKLPDGRYFELLADGSVLGWGEVETEGELASGIYRYDPDTGESTLLVEEMAPLLLREPM